MDTLKELTECLALQKEIDAKVVELRKRCKAVIEAERKRGNDQTIVVKIDNQMYALEREDNSRRLQREAMTQVHELGGFYLYRLFKVGKFIE
jgi:hypothetical protein